MGEATSELKGEVTQEAQVTPRSSYQQHWIQRHEEDADVVAEEPEPSAVPARRPNGYLPGGISPAIEPASAAAARMRCCVCLSVLSPACLFACLCSCVPVCLCVCVSVRSESCVCDCVVVSLSHILCGHIAK